MDIIQTPGAPLDYSFPGQKIYWRNLSSVVTDAQVYEVIKAIQVQITRDFFPVWGINAQLDLYDVHRSFDQWQLVFLDDADQANALGYHSLTSEGMPLARVFVRTTMEAGLRWSVVASHEILEILVDPYCELTAFNQDTENTGIMLAYEVCDPVESDITGYDIGEIRVSNFVLPTWFQPGHTGLVDFLGQLSGPCQLGYNGYMSFFSVGEGSNQWSQTFADTRKESLQVTSTERLALRMIPKFERKRSI
jgi:hypothetical protein